MATFEEQVDELDKVVEVFFKSQETEDSKLMIDGVVDVEKYQISNPKILWILKEPYDNDDGGGWSIAKFLAEDDFLKKIGRASKTWHPIIYVTYGILNNFLHYDDMDFIKNNPEMKEVLKSIAFMNIQKLAAKSVSNNKEIANAYNRNKEILFRQLQLFNPDIVIGGNTLHHFKDDLKPGKMEYDEFEYSIKGKRLYIFASHPGQRRSGEDTANYIDDIIRIAENWKNRKVLLSTGL